MTNSDADPRKKTDDFAKNLVHTMFGLDKLPADVGGEVLFDDYDDSPKGGSADAAAESGATAELTEAAAAEPRNSRTEYQDDIDDLIMFPEDDDQEDAAAEVCFLRGDADMAKSDALVEAAHFMQQSSGCSGGAGPAWPPPPPPPPSSVGAAAGGGGGGASKKKGKKGRGKH